MKKVSEWIRTEVKEGMEVELFVFKDGLSCPVVAVVDHVKVDPDDDGFTRVYAGGKIFDVNGLCHENGNNYIKIRPLPMCGGVIE